MESTDECSSSDSSARGTDGRFRVETEREGPIMLALLISEAIIIELQTNDFGNIVHAYSQLTFLGGSENVYSLLCLYLGQGNRDWHEKTFIHCLTLAQKHFLYQFSVFFYFTQLIQYVLNMSV